LKIVSNARGKIPLSLASLGTPVMVNDLPVPVCPYAKRVPLYPYKTLSRIGKAVSLKISSYSEFQSYTESKVKTFGASSPGF